MQLAERELLLHSNEIGSESSLTAAVAQSLSNETKITNKLRRLFVDSKLPSPTSSSSSSLTKVLPLSALSYLSNRYIELCARIYLSNNLKKINDETVNNNGNGEIDSSSSS